MLLEGLHLDRAIGAVEEEIRELTDRLVHPRGTWTPSAPVKTG